MAGKQRKNRATRTGAQSGSGQSGSGAPHRARPGRRGGGDDREHIVRGGRPASGSSGGAARGAAPPAWLLPVGAVLLLTAIASSAMLVLQHLGGLSLPGCGPGSACAQAAGSVWGKVPGIGWPTSHVGLAWFTALLAAWIAARGRLTALIRGVVFAGAAGSLLLTAVMIAGGYLCQYCLVVHAANLLFAGLLLGVSGRAAAVPARGLRSPAAIAASGFIVATLLLVIVEGATRRGVEREDERDLAQSTQDIIDRTRARSGTDGAAAPDRSLDRLSVPIVGRWRQGPAEAPIRIVAISDYQCPDCHRVEQELELILAEIPGVSLSAKHFPMCSDCNRFARANNFNPHPNACWAARAAETAGLLYGNEGFWKMHRWLFEQKGSFTDAQIRAGLAELGFDVSTFLAKMTSQESLAPVEADIEEARSLGLVFTPMIFVNGVELRGWRAVNGVRRAVEALAATSPPPAGPGEDRPVLAFGKYIEDWRQEVPRIIQGGTRPWAEAAGPEELEVLVFGDYSEPNCREVDARLRAHIGDRAGVRYIFRHYPMSNACNAQLSGTIDRAGACIGARAAEAAGRLGGAEAYRRMHAWLFAQTATITEPLVRSGATSLGLDPDRLLREMDSPEVAAGIAEDTEAGRRAFIRGVPAIFIARKNVFRWSLEGLPVLERILDEAMPR